MPEWLAGPLELVLRDLQRPGPVEVRLGWTADSDEAGVLWIQEVACAPELSGFHVDRLDAGAVAVWVADQLQEEFVESGGAWGETRPACPGHGHPADPDLRDGIAWWFCPQTREPLWPVGQAP